MIDCPDPEALAALYGALLGWSVEPGEDIWFVRADYGDALGFQRVEGYTAPRWPGRRG